MRVASSLLPFAFAAVISVGYAAPVDSDYDFLAIRDEPTSTTASTTATSTSTATSTATSTSTATAESTGTDTCEMIDDWWKPFTSWEVTLDGGAAANDKDSKCGAKVEEGLHDMGLCLMTGFSCKEDGDKRVLKFHTTKWLCSAKTVDEHIEKSSGGKKVACKALTKEEKKKKEEKKADKDAKKEDKKE